MALKVFNWLNRKMHANIEYCHIDQNKTMEGKEDTARESLVEQDTEALLLRDVLLNQILTIGTLGHHVHSLCPEACAEEEESAVTEKESMQQEKSGEEDNQEETDETTAIAASAPAPVVEPIKMRSSSTKEEKLACALMECVVAMEVGEEEDAAMMQERPLLMVEKGEKVRTTLADLFAAEALAPSDPGKQTSHHQNVTVAAAAASTSKPILRVEKMQQKKPTKSTQKPVKATRKLSRVVRKMLGKKIHPEQLSGRSSADGPLTG